MPRTSNLEYWRAREETQRQKNITDEREIQRRIQEIYTEMLSNVEKEINGFYAKYARAEGITISEAKRRAEKADIEALGLKAKRYVKEKDFSKLANAEMRLYNMTMKANRLELLKADIGLEMVAGFNEVEKTVGNALTERALGEFERQAGILGKSILNNAESAKTIVNASFNNAKFSDRIWMYQDMLKHELAKELQTGLIQGRNPRQLATHIRKRFGVSQSNAERLMVTEMARVQIAAQMESYKRNGFDHYMFIAEHDRRTCAVCGGLDGKTFLVSEEQPGLNAPPMHPNCRCSTAAYVERTEPGQDILGESTKEISALKNKYGQEITVGEKALERYSEEQIELLKMLINEYNTRLLNVTVGAKKAAGDVDMSGATMRLNSKDLTVLLHEFAHTMANNAADKLGLTDDKEFWREIKRIQREYRKSVENDPTRWISSYEHSKRSVDEFFAEAFTHAKARALGIKLPTKYGGDFEYSKRVLDATDKYYRKPYAGATGSGIIKQKIPVENVSDALLFFNGKDRADKYSEGWSKASLSESINKFAPGSSGVVNTDRGKIVFQNSDSDFAVVYDYNGDYFRIENTKKNSRRRYTDLDGNDMANITENGKTRGRTKNEYENATHFTNNDNEESV